jgi:hypothetical protein
VSALVLVLTCLMATSTYSGAITTSALLLFVLPCLVITVLVAFRFRSSTLPALITVGMVGLATSEVVNLVSGSGYGPAARSSFLAAAGSGAAVVLAASAAPALLLLPVAGMVAGALALGAAQEVRGPSAATAVTALVALAVVEHRRRRPVGLPLGLPGVAAPLLISAVLGVLLVNVQNERFAKDPYLPFPGSVRAEIRPFSPPSPTPSPTARPTPAASVSASPTPTPTLEPEPTEQRSTTQVLRTVLWFVLVLLSPVAVWLLVRARAAAAGRRARRRLRRGSGKPLVMGAWVWAAARRASLGEGFDRWESPDVLLATGVLEGDAAWTELATLVSRVAFADAANTEDLGSAAWAVATTAWDETRAASPWWRRLWSDVRSARGVTTNR